MLTQEPVYTPKQPLQAEGRYDKCSAVQVQNAGFQNSGLQVLCHEVERQLNRHYKRVLVFLTEAFSDKPDYPLRPEQALMLFCISNGVRDVAQLCRAIEPVTEQSIIILAGLYAHGYVASEIEAVLTLTDKGQAVADGLYELYTYVFLGSVGKDVPDTVRLASMHVSLCRLQKYNVSHQLFI